MNKVKKERLSDCMQPGVIIQFKFRNRVFNMVYPNIVIFQQPYSSTELPESSKLKSAFVLSGQPYHFQMEKVKENSACAQKIYG